MVMVQAGAHAAGAIQAKVIPTALTPAGAQAVFRAVLDVLARPGTVGRLPSAADEPLAGHVPAALLPLLALADLSTPACVVGDDRGGAGASRRRDGTPVKGGPGTGSGAGVGAGAGRPAAWDEIVRVATNAPRAALGDARLVAALRPLSAGELAGLRTGTAAAPEEGALACLAVAGIALTDGVGAAAGTGTADTVDAAAGTGTARTVGGGGHGSGAAGPAGTDGGNSGRLLLRVSGPGVPGTRALVVTGLPAGFAAARRRLVAGFPAGADLLLVAPDGAVTGLPRTTEVTEEVI